MGFILALLLSTASAIEAQLGRDFVDLSSHPMVKLDIRYATTNNFTKKNLYGDWKKCYLHADAAKKFERAAEALQRLKPGWRFLIFDCLRPRSVQRLLWDVVKGTPNQRYVANPDIGSIHNYGFAIDLSLVDSHGNEIDMGTAYDTFSALSEPRFEERFLFERRLTETHVANRKILRSAMLTAGFRAISNEWWHFDGESLDTLRKRHNRRIIE